MGPGPTSTPADRDATRIVRIHGDALNSIIATGDKVRINYQVQQVVALPGYEQTRLKGPGSLRYGKHLEVLLCDRDIQWGALDRLLSLKDNRILFLPGPRGEGHRYFVDRIWLGIKCGLPTKLFEISWGSPPACPRLKHDYLEALAAALDVEPQELGPALREQLLTGNVILLHPCVWDNFDEAPLVNYYT